MEINTYYHTNTNTKEFYFSNTQHFDGMKNGFLPCCSSGNKDAKEEIRKAYKEIGYIEIEDQSI